MLRRAPDVEVIATFDNLPTLHHMHPVGDVTHHGKIVRDEQQREPEFFFQFNQQVEDLRLNGHVERRNRLVADEQRGL